MNKYRRLAQFSQQNDIIFLYYYELKWHHKFINFPLQAVLSFTPDANHSLDGIRVKATNRRNKVSQLDYAQDQNPDGREYSFMQKHTQRIPDFVQKPTKEGVSNYSLSFFSEDKQALCTLLRHSPYETRCKYSFPFLLIVTENVVLAHLFYCQILGDILFKCFLAILLPENQDRECTSVFPKWKKNYNLLVHRPFSCLCLKTLITKI